MASHDGRRVKLFVSKWTSDHSSLVILYLFSLSLTVRFALPSGHWPYLCFTRLFHPPTHSMPFNFTGIEEGLGVSHWLPHQPFAQEPWQSYYMTASSSSHTYTIPVHFTIISLYPVAMWMLAHETSRHNLNVPALPGFPISSSPSPIIILMPTFHSMP